MMMVAQPDDADGADSPDGRLDKKEKVKALRKRGNLEDAVFGLICHNCRQRRVEAHVTCSRCPIRFCGRCLLNRHGENIELELRETARWVCPRCRGGCGPGCFRTCCNCGPCRKSRNLEPTGLLVRTAREVGFSNVHDYLVHLETGESPAAIASRKHGRGWTSTDGSHAIVAVVTGQQHEAQALKTKKKRSKRFLLVNSRWGSSTIPGYNDQEVHEWRLLITGFSTSWEVGRKVKSSWPTYSTENQFFTREDILDSTWETGRDLQSESPESQTEDQVQSLDSTQETGREPGSKKKRKIKSISTGLPHPYSSLLCRNTEPFGQYSMRIDYRPHLRSHLRSL